LTGLSGHADKDGLIRWVTGFAKKPGKVFVVHGEDKVCTAFAECLRAEYGIQAYAPYSGTCFNLITGCMEYEAEPVLRKKTSGPASTAYAKFLAAAQRLLNAVQKQTGLANKDMEKITDQIHALCDKIER
jgi:metallo-beta-lactamase family protein